jgi:hypothetical protein
VDVFSQKMVDGLRCKCVLTLSYLLCTPRAHESRIRLVLIHSQIKGRIRINILLSVVLVQNGQQIIDNMKDA